jgi:hypothetical protein
VLLLDHPTVESDQTTAQGTAREYCGTSGQGLALIGGVLVEKGRKRGFEELGFRSDIIYFSSFVDLHHE